MEKQRKATGETVQTVIDLLRLGKFIFSFQVFNDTSAESEFFFPHRRTVRLKKNSLQRAKPAAKKSTEGMNIYLLYCILCLLMQLY